MQTILGAGGAIGIPLATELIHYTDHIRLVGRNPKKVNSTDELMVADLTKKDDVDRAIAGSDIVYVVIGFPYSAKIWAKTWPPFIENVINACRKHDAKLVLFDNVYLYAREAITHMTELSPVDPPSRKGKTRAQVASLVMKANTNGIAALIARAPDFYGPGKVTSTLTETVIKNLKKGKKALWIGDADAVHQFIFTPDAGRAVALLGNTPEAYGQTWHLPTHQQKQTIRQWTSLIAKALDVPDRLFEIPSFALKAMGMVVPLMAELAEMNYQNERDYCFDCTKFTNAFPNFLITTPEEAIQAIVEK